MSVSKIAVSIDQKVVHRLDALVKKGVFPSRSRAIQVALATQLDKIDRNRLARECSKLDQEEEKKIAEVGMASEVALWPEY
jgi:Arc/MetJ-type ribon-helix-helix transcriptional regulator